MIQLEDKMPAIEIVPRDLIDLGQLNTMTISGRGGKEFEIGSKLFPTARRESTSLNDFVLVIGPTTIRLEIKKQQNLQWFDIRKYHRLSEEDRKIVLVFVNHWRKKVDLIAAVQLGDFIDLVLSKPDFKDSGWTAECIERAYELTRPDRYPKLQFKAGLRVRDLINDNSEQFQIIYKNDSTKGRVRGPKIPPLTNEEVAKLYI